MEPASERSGPGAWMARRPAVGLALGLTCGLALVRGLHDLPVGATVALAVLSLAWRRRAGRALAAVALGLLVGWVRVEAPVRGDQAVRAERPVTAQARLEGALRPSEGGWSAPARLSSLRQGDVVATSPRLVWLFVGGDARPPVSRTFWARGFLEAGEPPGNGADGPIGPSRLTIKSQRLLSGPVARRVPPGVPAASIRRVRFDEALVSSRGLQLAVALLLGQPWRLDESLRQSLRDWGLAHLTAASGLHVGIVALALGGVSAWCAPRWRWLAPAAAVAGYCLLVGERPSLLRAALMLGLAWAARGVGRRPDPVNAVAAAGAALLLLEPRLLDDLGFRLSFAATVGILVLAPCLQRAWRGPGWGRTALSVSVAAQLATLPFTATTFSTVPLLAPLLNLAFVPWTALCLLVGGAWLGAWQAGLPVDPAWLAPLALPFEWLARFEAPWWAAVTWTPAFPVALLVAGLLAAVLARPRWWSLLSLPIAFWLALAPARAPGAELWMLDVGQGDGLLLRSGRRTVLIDGGGWRRGDYARRVLLPALSRAGVRRLDLAILSHPDADHCAGMAELIGRIPIAELWVGPGAEEAACGARLVAGLGSKVEEVAGGERATIGEWRLTVAPIAAGGSANRRSVALRAEAAGSSVLFTGDLDREGERALLRSGFDLRADVLKVPHHGSRSSSTAAFLNAVSPRYALISAGRGNSYGHPAREVVERLLHRGATVLRTDLDGRVALRFSPESPIGFEAERIRSMPGDGSPRPAEWRWRVMRWPAPPSRSPG